MRIRTGPILRGVIAATCLAIAVIGALLLPRPLTVSAHPLGNFTINQYSGITIGADSVWIKYILDMAEIPTFQEMETIDIDNNGAVSDEERIAYMSHKAAELARGLSLSVDGSTVPLEIADRQLDFPPGQGALPTLRLAVLLVGELPLERVAHGDLHYQVKNYPERLGWREIVIEAASGVSLVHTNALTESRSVELTAFPEDGIKSPPDMREAGTAFVVNGPVGLEAGQQVALETRSDDKPDSLLASLISVEKLSLPVIILALAVALGLGALHAASPGHGKTIMAAYLVGARGTVIHALFLGVAVTVSHTVGVLGLGLVILLASHVFAPETLYPWLGLTSGIIIIVIAAWLLNSRIRGHVEHQHHQHLGAEHHHGHHAHQHDHDHTPRLQLTWKTLATLGLVGGLVPSTSALVILLAAVSLQREGFGLVLILAFGAGMAMVLSGVGLALVYASRVIEGLSTHRPLTHRLAAFAPYLTIAVILASGLLMAARALLEIKAF